MERINPVGHLSINIQKRQPYEPVYLLPQCCKTTRRLHYNNNSENISSTDLSICSICIIPNIEVCEKKLFSRLFAELHFLPGHIPLAIPQLCERLLSNLQVDRYV